MRSIQISFDEIMFKEIEHFASTMNISQADIIKTAVKQWLIALETKKLEDNWIKKLKNNPDNSEDAEKWSSIQYWSDDESWCSSQTFFCSNR